MFRLLETLDSDISFTVHDEVNSSAVLEFEYCPYFVYKGKIYNLDQNSSTDLISVWKNNLESFNLSASISDQFRQIVFHGYYNDGITIYKLTMTENYHVSFRDYSLIKDLFIDVLYNQYQEQEKQKQRRKTLFKSSVAVLVGITTYTIFGGLGLLTLPMLLVNNEKKVDRLTIDILREKNQKKTIFQLSELIKNI